MRRSLALLAALFTLSALAADPPAKPGDGKKADPPAKSKGDKKSDTPAKPKDDKKPDASTKPKDDSDVLAPEKDLPGPFHPYNVNGPRKGSFHCLVSEYGQEPVVMILSRDLEFSDAFKELLKQLDNAIAKNPAVRLKAFVAFLSDDVKDPVTDDDGRDKVVKKLEDLAAGLMLKHVVLALAGKADFDKYAPGSSAYVVVVYHKLAIDASFRLGPDTLTPAKVKEIMTTVGDKLGAKFK